jgi:endonuclease YncB( thermonuclease family)
MKTDQSQFDMLRILVVFLAIANIFLSTPTQAAGLPKADFQVLIKTGQAKVAQVISPLTLQLDNGQIVRLSGLHMPDYNGDQAGAFSVLALKVLQDLLVGQEIALYQTRKKDTGRINRMGHSLAHIARTEDGAWAQGLLLKLGLAISQTTQNNPEMAEAMRALENQAREEKLGLWENTISILSPQSAADHIGSFQIVEGRIESAALKKNRLYLNFGKNWRDDFTVTVAPEHRRAFSKQGINPLDWNGKIVRVRGWITEYNGPNMEIDHPQALELQTSNGDGLKKAKRQPEQKDNVLPEPLVTPSP